MWGSRPRRNLFPLLRPAGSPRIFTGETKSIGSLIFNYTFARAGWSLRPEHSVEFPVVGLARLEISDPAFWAVETTVDPNPAEQTPLTPCPASSELINGIGPCPEGGSQHHPGMCSGCRPSSIARAHDYR